MKLPPFFRLVRRVLRACSIRSRAVAHQGWQRDCPLGPYSILRSGRKVASGSFTLVLAVSCLTSLIKVLSRRLGMTWRCADMPPWRGGSTARALNAVIQPVTPGPKRKAMSVLDMAFACRHCFTAASSSRAVGCHAGRLWVFNKWNSVASAVAPWVAAAQARKRKSRRGMRACPWLSTAGLVAWGGS